MANTTSEAIVKWAEAHTDAKPPAPNKGAKHLTAADVCDVLRWHKQGLTQQQIAARFHPPKSQSAISRVIARYGTDNTAEAKQILRGGAADMALNIVRRGQPKDQVQALKGLGVLQDAQQQGVTVIVGSGGQVNVGVMVSPPVPEVTSESA